MKKVIWQNFLQQQQEVMIKTGTFFPVKTIIGKDLDVRGTFNADIASTPPGLIPAGRFMVYEATPGSKTLTPYAGAYVGAAGAQTIVGILAQDVDTTPAPGGPNSPANIPAVGMIYRAGTFLLQEIEEANGVAQGIRDPSFLEQLRFKGILFEWSWEGYALMENPPQGPSLIP